MKEIQPLNGFWYKNGFASATHLKFYLGNDNLKNTAVFYYQFVIPSTEDESEIVLGAGNLYMTGETYENWDGSNAGAWNFAVKQLGVILVETK